MNANDIWLIAGLGNPEAKYEGTRHNAGFAALDSLAGKWGISVSKTKFQGLWGQGEVDSHKVVLLKPLTYMNLSGDSIAPLAGFFKIPADHVIVLCDDITQAPGKLRIRPSGSAGGHNGLKSIIARPASASAWVPSPARTMTLPTGYWASSRPRTPKPWPTATPTWRQRQSLSWTVSWGWHRASITGERNEPSQSPDGDSSPEGGAFPHHPINFPLNDKQNLFVKSSPFRGSWHRASDD